MCRVGFAAGLKISALAMLIIPTAALAAPPEGKPAVFTLTLPADAQIWFDGVITRQVGSVRIFESPPLPVGKQFSYRIRARWQGDRGAVELSRQVSFTGGDRITLDWMPPSINRTPAQLTPPRTESRILDFDEDFFPFNRRPSEWDH